MLVDSTNTEEEWDKVNAIETVYLKKVDIRRMQAAEKEND